MCQSPCTPYMPYGASVHKLITFYIRVILATGHHPSTHTTATYHNVFYHVICIKRYITLPWRGYFLSQDTQQEVKESISIPLWMKHVTDHRIPNMKWLIALYCMHYNVLIMTCIQIGQVSVLDNWYYYTCFPQLLRKTWKPGKRWRREPNMDRDLL